LHLAVVPGFVEFQFLKGPEAQDHPVYASHTVWENRAVFEAWTKPDPTPTGEEMTASAE